MIIKLLHQPDWTAPSAAPMMSADVSPLLTGEEPDPGSVCMSRLKSRMPLVVRARPRLFIAAAGAVALGLLLPAGLIDHAVTRCLIAWNAGTCLYILLAAVMMSRSSAHQMRRRAQLQDDGATVILMLVALAAIASLAAIAGELAVVKDMHGWFRAAHVALTGVTVMSSWGFIQIMFALHYAHEYYGAVCRGDPGGLDFPGDTQPDYGDFFYFSTVVGTSGQTADVAFTSRRLRRIGTLHCILAYLFNTIVLALLINIAASLL